MIQPPAVIAPSEVPQRCICPECRRLDREHPNEGYQLAMFGYRVQLPRLTAVNFLLSPADPL